MNPVVDCACVIHGSLYDWIYVDKLYAMLSRNISGTVRLHVFTEATRTVPAPYIKHALTEWAGISGARKSWWYKMQMFDPDRFYGRLLYFDLDVVILQNIDWIVQLDDEHFWACRDFQHCWRGAWHGINSSCMTWHTGHFARVWREFSGDNIQDIVRRFPGDQDYLNQKITQAERRFFPVERFRSWRWEIHDGGIDPTTRAYRQPGAGSQIPDHTHVMVFHGHPKPQEISDPVIQRLWG